MFSVCPDTLGAMWNRMVAAGRGAAQAVQEATKSFGRDRGGRMAAAVSYRTMFALTPLLLIAVSVFGLVIGGSDAARATIMETVEGLVGPSIAGALDMFMISASDTSGTAALVGFALFVWTASTLFMEVQNGLNDIFGVPYEATAGIIGFIKKRGLGFVWAIGLGLLTVAVWLLNVVWGWLGDLFPPTFEPVHRLLAWMTPLVSLALFPIIFAVSFKTLTAVSIRWRAAWKGGFFTALVFVLTAFGARVYFAWDSDTSAPQVAAGVFLLMLLSYFLSTAFLIGAQMTRIYNDRLNEDLAAAK